MGWLGVDNIGGTLPVETIRALLARFADGEALPAEVEVEAGAQAAVLLGRAG